MAERPMLMSAPMVRAILAGTKTQTRRIVKPQPTGFIGGPGVIMPNGAPAALIPMDDTVEPFGRQIICPYGQPGDQLWVRETYMPDPPDDGTWAGTSWRGCKGSRLEDIPERFRSSAHCLHRASWSGTDLAGWKPSIHMPRWASRITLEITGVRVERLQDISETDCVAEGCPGGAGAIPGYAYAATPLEHYHWLWNDINGAGAWELNPWVWAVEFRRVKP